MDYYIKELREKHGGWPKEAYFSSGNLRMTHEDMNDYDTERCGPVLLIDGEWAWCNKGPSYCHINNGGDGPYCSYCGEEL
tara:strand:+ start:1039 stop:1278 length:240 start_codon:yes stop_codon:yes gene_type:complete